MEFLWLLRSVDLIAMQVRQNENSLCKSESEKVQTSRPWILPPTSNTIRNTAITTLRPFLSSSSASPHQNSSNNHYPSCHHLPPPQILPLLPPAPLQHQQPHHTLPATPPPPLPRQQHLDHHPCSPHHPQYAFNPNFNSNPNPSNISHQLHDFPQRRVPEFDTRPDSWPDNWVCRPHSVSSLDREAHYHQFDRRTASPEIDRLRHDLEGSSRFRDLELNQRAREELGRFQSDRWISDQYSRDFGIVSKRFEPNSDNSSFEEIKVSSRDGLHTKGTELLRLSSSMAGPSEVGSFSDACRDDHPSIDPCPAFTESVALSSQCLHPLKLVEHKSSCLDQRLPGTDVEDDNLLPLKDDFTSASNSLVFGVDTNKVSVAYSDDEVIMPARDISYDVDSLNNHDDGLISKSTCKAHLCQNSEGKAYANEKLLGGKPIIEGACYSSFFVSYSQHNETILKSNDAIQTNQSVVRKAELMPSHDSKNTNSFNFLGGEKHGRKNQPSHVVPKSHPTHSSFVFSASKSTASSTNSQSHGHGIEPIILLLILYQETNLPLVRIICKGRCQKRLHVFGVLLTFVKKGTGTNSIADAVGLTIGVANTSLQRPTTPPLSIVTKVPKHAINLSGRWKMLLLRKRSTVYTRSINGFSIRKSKVLSVGGSSLKWSKSIERRSRKANEEATLTVAEAERKKREGNGSVSGTGKRSHSCRKVSHGTEVLPAERIFHIGPVCYKMDSSRRSLQRIAEDESSCSASHLSESSTKKSYVPRRLVIGNDEYVRIGNGNQLVRDPKKRTHVLASEKVRWSLHTARLRLVKKQYCQFFTRFGKCNKDDGRCLYIHDPSKIAVCTKFLKGLCSNSNCKLTHKVIPERMPDCSYFLQGLCTNENCPYRHVHVNPNASTCKGFLKGYCADGNECRKKHSYVCPYFEATASGPQGSKCKLHHPKNRSKGKKRKRSVEHKNAHGRYFGIDISEPKSMVYERHQALFDDNIFFDGKFSDYIRLDVSVDEAGELHQVICDQTAFDDHDSLDLQLDDLGCSHQTYWYNELV
ncbi:hypothetical protein DITRI_Ditri05aG0115200 [Diplodiscus trichospermus]